MLLMMLRMPPGLPAEELLDLKRIAGDLHRRARWTADPLKLAAVDGVRVYPSTIGEVVMRDVIFYEPSAKPRDRALSQAHALAVCLLRRRGRQVTERAAWHLAAELIAPEWALPHCSPAPTWLVRARRPGSVATSVIT